MAQAFRLVYIAIEEPFSGGLSSTMRSRHIPSLCSRCSRSPAPKLSHIPVNVGRVPGMLVTPTEPGRSYTGVTERQTA